MLNPKTIQNNNKAKTGVDDLNRSELMRALAQPDGQNHAQELVQAGADLTTVTTYDWNILHFAARHNHLWLFKHLDTPAHAGLMTTLFEQSCTDIPEDSLLSIAALNGNTEIVAFILDKFYQETRNSADITAAINGAIHNDHDSCVRVILEFCPDLKGCIDPESKNSILHKVAFENATKTFEMLQVSYPHITPNLMNQTNAENLKPIGVALQCERWDLVLKMKGYRGMDSLEILCLETLLKNNLDIPRDDFLVRSPEEVRAFVRFKEQHGSDFREATHIRFANENSGTVWKI